MSPLPSLLLLVGLAACSSVREEVLDDVVVDQPDFVDDEPVDGAVFLLDTAARPELVFTAWGMGGVEQHGTWSRYNVRVVQPEDGLEDLRVSVRVDMASVKTAHEALDRHLKTADFFDVANHPDGLFESSAVVAAGDGLFTVSGELTLRGTTRPISFPARIEADGAGLISSASMEFSRWDFGLYPEGATGPGSDHVDDRVVFDYSVRLAPAN